MIKEYIVAMRFFTTMAHFLALLILFATIPNNIRVSLGDGVLVADEQVARQTALAALIIGIFCFMFDFRGLFFATSLFNYTVCVVDTFVIPRHPHKSSDFLFILDFRFFLFFLFPHPPNL